MKAFEQIFKRPVGVQVRDQVWEQVSAQVRDQVSIQVWEQVGVQVRDQVSIQVWVQLGMTMIEHINRGASDEHR